MGRKGEKFPGLDVIRNREPTGRPVGRPGKRWTAAELAKMPPSQRRRVLHRTTPVLADDGKTIVRAERPGTLTRELIGAIIADLEQSAAPPYIIAGTHGVPRATWDDWIRRGESEDAEPLHRELVESVARARSASLKGLTSAVAAGGRGSSGAAWLLERYERGTFAPPTSKTEITGAGGGAIKIEPMVVALPEEVGPHGAALAIAASSKASGDGVAASSNGKSSNGARYERQEPEAARTRAGAGRSGEEHKNGFHRNGTGLTPIGTGRAAEQSDDDSSEDPE